MTLNVYILLTGLVFCGTHCKICHLTVLGEGKELFSIKDLGMSVDILRKQPRGTADKAPRSITKGTVTQMHSIFTGWHAARFSRLMSDVMLSPIWVSA